jgi:hypothetical protein
MPLPEMGLVLYLMMEAEPVSETFSIKRRYDGKCLTCIWVS